MSSLHPNQQDKSKSLDEYIAKTDLIFDSRFLQSAFSCLGKNVEIQLEDGTKGQGKFYTTTLETGGIVLKNFSKGKGENGVVPTKILDRDDFVYFLASNIEDPPLINAKKDVFKTDSEISKNKTLDQRKLVKWSGDDNEEPSGGGLVLEELASQGGKWNQFELNEKKFGLTSHYKEEMYTTQLNMDKVSASLLEKAARIEAEILNSTSDFGNRHIREERGLQALKEENDDEELAYSSVIRTDSKKDSTKIDDTTRPKFFNSKRTVSNPGEAGTPVETKTTDNKKDKAKEVATLKPKPVEEPKINLLNKTPKGETTTDDQSFKRTVSNVSEETPQSKTRSRLSLNANTFVASESKTISQVTTTTAQEETKKEEVRPSFSKQTSLQNEEKKINMSDYNSHGITKFRVKINDIKKSTVTFFDYAIPDWSKKENPPDPANVNQNWKIAKTTQPPAPISVIKSTPSTQATTPSSKPVTTPSTNSMPFTSPGMIPTFTGAPNMMLQNPYSNPQIYPPNMGGMMYTHPRPGFPSYPQYGNFPPQQFVVNPSDPNFNLGYNQQQHRQSGPPHKNFKGNKN